MPATDTDLSAEIRQLRTELKEAQRLARRANDRGEIENLFNRYMYLHNAFQDEHIIPLWVKPGTPGIRARYTNAGQYTDHESVIRYHRDRPNPVGKLILHYTTTLDLMYFGDDGKPVFMPPADEPVPTEYHPYSPSARQTLEPQPPVPHPTFTETFE